MRAAAARLRQATQPTPTTTPHRATTTTTTMPTTPRVPISKCKRFVLLTTSLDERSIDMVKELATNLGAIVTDKYSNNVTHVITACDQSRIARRTLKYCFAVMEGKWAVSFEWIKKCTEEECWVAEDKYEISGDFTAVGAPKLSRESRDNELPPLFDNYRIYLYGDVVSPTKEDLKKLLKLGGADIATTLPRNATYKSLINVIVCDTNYVDGKPDDEIVPIKTMGIPFVDYGWVLDSVSYYKVLDVDDYLVS